VPKGRNAREFFVCGLAFPNCYFASLYGSVLFYLQKTAQDYAIFSRGSEGWTLVFCSSFLKVLDEATQDIFLESRVLLSEPLLLKFPRMVPNFLNAIF